jgi:HAD superfamily hydrolase (TIGR01549 family)
MSIVLPSAFIFDLDDTLVSSQLDFTQMRTDIGCPADVDILQHVAQLHHTDAELGLIAADIIEQHEIVEAQSSKWLAGAQEFVQRLSQESIPMAIVTRNCRAATAVKRQQNNIPIEFVLTREDAPAKPDPTGLLQIAKEWAIAPSEIAYVGDYLYDIQAANNANMQAWSYGFRETDLPVHHVFECWHELNQTLFSKQ